MDELKTKRDEMFLKVQERALAVRQRYAETAVQWANILIYGDFGTGKTQVIGTAPRPIFIDSFDPGGTKTAALQPLIASGDIIVDNRWEGDSWKQPWAFAEWEREMDRRKREGFFDYLGTYALDSITKWAQALIYEILKRGTKGVSRAGNKPELQDYLIQQLTAVDWLSQLMQLPCHTIVTGHMGFEKDEYTGKMETGLLLEGKLSGKVPLVFDEKYITRVKETPSGTNYTLQTRNDGYYKAETRMGGVDFAAYEEPDLRALLKRAGKEWQDRPGLFAEPETPVTPGEKEE